MAIRLSRRSDLESMVDIYNQAILTKRCTADTETFSLEERILWFESHQNNEYPLFVYEIDNKVVGFIYLSSYRPGRKAMRNTVEVSYYIHNDYFKQGIGSMLLEHGIQVSKDLKYKTLLAILLDFNIPSICILKKFKFEEWGRLPDIAEFEHGICSHLYYGLKL